MVLKTDSGTTENDSSNSVARWRSLLLGVLAGAIGYYFLSLSSAFTSNSDDSGGRTIAVLLSVATGAALTVLALTKPLAGTVAAVASLALAVIGYFVGPSTAYALTPSPGNLVPLLGYGAYSPLVLTVSTMLLIIGIVRMRARRHHLNR